MRRWWRRLLRRLAGDGFHASTYEPLVAEEDGTYLVTVIVGDVIGSRIMYLRRGQVLDVRGVVEMLREDVS